MTVTDTRDVDLRVRQILNRRPAVGFALGVVRAGGAAAFHVHGVAETGAGTPVTEDTAFRIASVTKTFTAVAVLQLQEQGALDLDAPVADVLRGLELVPKDPRWRPVTVRHLLTHTAGLGEVSPPWAMFRPDLGETVEPDGPLPSLADYYRGAVRVRAEPGTRFRYSDHGFAVLGQVVEDVTGRRLAEHLREAVLAPLGMADTGLGRTDRIRRRLATGYTIGGGGPTAVREREWVTAAAAGAWSTPADLARFAAALLGGGANAHGRVLAPDTVAEMFAPQYRPDPRVPGLGLAFFRGETGGHPVVEHQGVLPGFDSQLLLAPEDGVGIVAVTNGTRHGPMWLPFETARLLHELLDVPPEVVPTDVPQRPDLWPELCGWYRLPGPLSDAGARSVIGAGVEVFVRRGRLMVRSVAPVPLLYRGFELHPADPADPYVFRLDLSGHGLDTLGVVFTPGPDGLAAAVHLDVMPLSAYRHAQVTNPRVWGQAAGALATAVAAGAAGRRLRRRGPARSPAR